MRWKSPASCRSSSGDHSARASCIPRAPAVADAVDRLLTGLGELDALGAPVVGVGDTRDITRLLQLLDGAGDVGGLHTQSVGQLARAHRFGVGDLPQQRHGGTVQRHLGQGHQPVVLPGPGAQVGDAGERPLDLDDFRGRGDVGERL